MITIYHAFESNELRAMVSDPLAPLIPLFPPWVLELHVYYQDASEDGSRMEIIADTRYGVVSLRAYPKFFEHDEDTRRLDIIHEFFHIFVGPMASYVNEHIIPYVKGENKELSEEYDRAFEDAHEQTVQHLTYAFEKLLPRKAVKHGR